LNWQPLLVSPDYVLLTMLRKYFPYSHVSDILGLN
jgi:hypothetical protein